MKLDIASESINFQYLSPLKGGLDVISTKLEKIRDLTARDVADSDLTDTILKLTGLNVKIEYNVKVPWAAYVTTPPTLDKNNPLLPSKVAEAITNNDLYEQIRNSGKVLEGTIDLKKGKVGGVFSKIESTIVLGKNLLSGKVLTPGEKTSIILHELGHLFVYYEYLSSTVKTISLLKAIGSEAYSSAPTKERIKILHEIDKAAGIDIPDKETTAGGSQETTSLVVVRECINQKRSEMNCDYYDRRSYEYLADQYAARHGAAVELASALNKLNKATRSIHSRGNVKHFFIEVISFIYYAFGGSLGSIFFIQMLLLYAASENRYDDPVERTTRLREQLIAQLQDKTLSDEVRASILNDIKTMDKLLPTIRSRKSFVELFWDKVIPLGRRNASVMSLQRDLEQLAHNELYYKSAQLKGEV